MWSVNTFPMFWLFKTLVTLACVHHIVSEEPERCPRGRILMSTYGGSKYCQSCAPGTFMPEDNHTKDKCYRCTKIRDPQKEILVSACNKTHDAVIHCIDGYYWALSPHPKYRGSCQKCKTCSVYKSPCQIFANAECCPGSDYEVYTNGSGQLECVLVCGRGQYLDHEAHRCMQCRKNTYMDDWRHTNMHCKNCEIPTDANEIVQQPCNSTHPSIIGCAEGFYRRQLLGVSSGVCVPCTNCSENKDSNIDIYEGRACSQSHDAVCCPQPGLKVVDAPNGTECQPVFVQPSKDHESKDASSLTTAEIVGIVIGVGLVLALAQTITFYALLCRWNLSYTRNRRAADEEEYIPLMPRAYADTSMLKVRRRLSESSNLGDSTESDTGFIPVTDFNNIHLPYAYCDDEMVELVKHQAMLTVLVNVTGSSEHRPEYVPGTQSVYPYAGHRYRNQLHTGSGWVERITIHTKQRCPCETCRPSDQPLMSWGEVVICTATRMVFDIIEGRNSWCVFFYDSNNAGLQSCPSLTNAVKVLSDVERDWCYMTYVTHNMELLKKLQKIHSSYHTLRRDVKHKYDVITDVDRYDEAMDEINPQLYSRFKHSLAMLQKKMSEIQRGSSNVPIPCESNVVTNYSFRLQDPSSGLGALLDITGGGDTDVDKAEKLMEMLTTLHKNYSQGLIDITEMKKHSQIPNAESDKLAVDKCRELCRKADELDRFVRCLTFNLGNFEDTQADNYPAYRPRYNPQHNLCIIVSHPQGCSQQISLGEVTDRKSLWYDHHSMYKYTNVTCQGCEGARVFILGRTGLSDHGHSGCIHRTGESGAWSDVVPYLCDLSAVSEVRTNREFGFGFSLEED